MSKLRGDAQRTLEQVLTSRGFDCDSLLVPTDDGYQLRLFRVRNPLLVSKANPTPVLLMHGLGADCTYWVINGTAEAADWTSDRSRLDNSLAVTLANHGFAVWLANMRGTRYELTGGCDFSIDELIGHDYPALVRAVLNESGQDRLVYVGFSQGGLMGLVASANCPELAAKVRHFVAVAVPYKLSKLTLDFNRRFLIGPVIRWLIRWPGFLFPQFLLDGLVYSTRIWSQWFGRWVVRLWIRDFNHYQTEALLAHVGLKIGRKNLAHFFQSQLRPDRTISHFDYGPEENRLRYGGSETAPNYELSRTHLPKISLINSTGDRLVLSEDFDSLHELLRPHNNIISHRRIEDPHFDHASFHMGLDCGRKFNGLVLEAVAEELASDFDA